MDDSRRAIESIMPALCHMAKTAARCLCRHFLNETKKKYGDETAHTPSFQRLSDGAVNCYQSSITKQCRCKLSSQVFYGRDLMLE